MNQNTSTKKNGIDKIVEAVAEVSKVKREAIKAIKADLENSIEEKFSVLSDELSEKTDSAIETIDEKLSEIENAIPTTESIVEQVLSELPPPEKGEPGEQGDPGKDADTTEIIETVTATVLEKLPKSDAIVTEVLGKIPDRKADLKIIQESIEIDPMSVIDKIMALEPKKRNRLQLSTDNISGLKQTISAFQSQLGRGYLHGGGLSDITGLITQGTNISIMGSGTKTSPYVINSTGENALTFSTGLTRTGDTITSNLSTGISGGQSVVGGTAASENITITSTSNATKGKILFGARSVIIEQSGFWGIGASTSSNLIVALGGYAPGTVTTTAGGNTVTGVGTQFLDTFYQGQQITINGEAQIIVAVNSNTSLTTNNWTGANTNANYTVTSGGTPRFNLASNGNITSLTGNFNLTQPNVGTSTTTNGVSRTGAYDIFFNVTGGNGGNTSYNPGSGTVSAGSGSRINFTTGGGGAIISGNPTLTAGGAGNFTIVTGSGGSINGSNAATTANPATGGAFTVQTGAGTSTSGIIGSATGGVGGSGSFVTGSGGTASASVTATGGAGGPFSFTTGNGAAGSTGTTRNGGAGGALTFTSGNGANVTATGATNATAGTGGTLSFIAGNGGTLSGTAASGTNTNGAGGSLNFTGGNAGAGLSVNANGGSIYFLGGTKGNSGTDGYVYLGQNAAGTKRGKIIAAVPVNLPGYTVATLPAGTIGDCAYVTDALAPVYGTALAGGGAVVAKAFFDGTNWINA